MAYTGDPSNVPRDAVRLEVGDVDLDFPILADADYDYFLTKNSSSVRRAAVDAAKSILFVLSRNTHERIESLEVWGGEWARSYMATLKMYINDPNYSIATNAAMPFAGGISKTSIRTNLEDTDAQKVDITRSLASTPTDGITDPYEENNPFADDYISRVDDPFSI